MSHSKCCPFCGDDLIEMYQSDDGAWYMQCSDCESTGPHLTSATKSDAIMLWNCRAVYDIGKIRKLAPCPFCGESKWRKVITDDARIRCLGCWASAHHNEYSSRWNQRSLFNIRKTKPAQWVQFEYGWGGEPTYWEQKKLVSMATLNRWLKEERHQGGIENDMA